MRVAGAYTLLVTSILLGLGITNASATGSGDGAFMVTEGRTPQPIGYHEFCRDHRAECDVRSHGRQRVTLTAALWNTLVAVNNKVNITIKPATDEQIFGRPEVWFYPTDRGDCEDYVLLKRRILLQHGWPVGALLITVVRQKNGDGHAVLTVLTDRGDLVLDNLNPHIVAWNKTPYVFLKRQSTYDTGTWVAIDDGRAMTVGSLHN